MDPSRLPPHFRFLDLPREMRDQIYEQLIWTCHEERQPHWTVQFSARPDVQYAIALGPSRNMLPVSKLVNGEYLQNCYRAAQTRCYITNVLREISLDERNGERTSIRIECPAQYFSKIRHCQVRYNLYQPDDMALSDHTALMQKFLDLLPLLQNLEVVVHPSWFQVGSFPWDGLEELSFSGYLPGSTMKLKSLRRALYVPLTYRTFYQRFLSPGLELHMVLWRRDKKTEKMKVTEEVKRDLGYWKIYQNSQFARLVGEHPEWFGTHRVDGRGGLTTREEPQNMRQYMVECQELKASYDNWEAAKDSVDEAPIQT